MRISNIKIHNYRQYRDVSFDFGRVNGKKDLHIIVGSNTLGKTNLMNAISWCLYDSEPHLRDEDRAIFRLNSTLENEIRQKGGGRENVEVQIALSTDTGGNVTFRRQEQFNISANGCLSISNNLTVFEQQENGDTKVVSDEVGTRSLVKKYLPKEINEFIFFDGERLEHFFDKEFRVNVHNGINDLTQASIIEKAITGFNSFIKDTLEPKLTSCGNSTIEDLQRKVTAQENVVKGVNDAIDVINNQIQLCEDNITRLTLIIRGNEKIGEKDAELKKVTADIADIEVKQYKNMRETMNFVRDYYPLMTIFPAVKEYYDYIKSRQVDSSESVKVDREELEKALSSGHCTVCGQELTDIAAKYIQKLLDSQASSFGAHNVFSQDLSYIRMAADKLLAYKEDADTLRSEARELAQKKQALERDQQALMAYMNSVPDSEDIKDAIGERTTWQTQRDENMKKLGIEQENLKRQERVLKELNDKLDAAMAKARGVSEIVEKKKYCKQCILGLKQTKEEILEECRLSMQEETFTTFKSLMWKQDAYSRVEIQKDYTFSLFDRFGNQTLGSSSSAETNLLALAFTQSLQMVSGHDSLLFIDTPVGRVDSDNRANFMHSLLKIADGKQTVLLFTPTEYDENIRAIIGGQYSTNRVLVNTDLTTIIQ